MYHVISRATDYRCFGEVTVQSYIGYLRVALLTEVKRGLDSYVNDYIYTCTYCMKIRFSSIT